MAKFFLEPGKLIWGTTCEMWTYSTQAGNTRYVDSIIADGAYYRCARSGSTGSGSGKSGVFPLPKMADVQIYVDQSAGGALFKGFYVRGPSYPTLTSAFAHPIPQEPCYGFLLEGKTVKIYRSTTLLGEGTRDYPIWPVVSGRWFYVLDVRGTLLRAKHWRENNLTEGDWIVQVTDSQISSGYTGCAFQWTDGERALVGIGTDGDDAPRESLAPVVVSGTVTLAGSPVSGAMVLAYRYGVVEENAPVFPGINFVTAQTNANGQYNLVFKVHDPGPWIVCATAVINGVLYASDARLVTLS